MALTKLDRPGSFRQLETDMPMPQWKQDMLEGINEAFSQRLRLINHSGFTTATTVPVSYLWITKWWRLQGSQHDECNQTARVFAS